MKDYSLITDPDLFEPDWKPPPGEYNPDCLRRIERMRKRYFELLPVVLEAARQRNSRRLRQLVSQAGNGWDVKYDPSWDKETRSDDGQGDDDW